MFYYSTGTVSIVGKKLTAGKTGYGVYNANGPLVISAGTVELADDADTTSCAVQIDNGSVSITGGTVNGKTGTAVYHKAGTVTISGPGTTIEATTGTAVLSEGTVASVTINAGTEVKATDDDGNAVKKTGGGTLTINGGEFSATTGSAVINEGGGTISITLGNFTAATTTAPAATIVNSGAGSITINKNLSSPLTLEVKATGVGGTSINNSSTGNISITGCSVQSNGTGTTSGIINGTGYVTVTGGSVTATAALVNNNPIPNSFRVVNKGTITGTTNTGTGSAITGL